MLRHRPFVLVAVAGAILTAALSPLAVAAAGPTVECGQLSGYTAPDPAGPTDGSLQIGVLPAWVVLATATLSPAAATALPTAAGNGPTCVAISLDADGKVTSIDFAPAGTIAGHVTFDSGSGYYLFGDRLLIPAAITDAYPALGALFATSASANSALTITFTVDTTTGAFTGFNGVAAFCGVGSLAASGDGKVGSAVIPKAVLDAADRAALKKASGHSVCASVHSTGTIDAGSGSISTAADVRITADPGAAAGSLPPTDATPPVTASADDPPPAALAAAGGAFLLAGLGLFLGLGRRRREAA